MKTLGIGIVGAGTMGRYYHGPSYLRMRSVRLRAILDVDRKRAEQVAAQLNVKEVCTEPEDFFKKPGIDVVDICVPTPWHAEYTIRSAEAGKHVLCEKPIALDLEAADRMITATRKAGVKFMVAHVLRFDPAYATAKRLIDSGDLGTPLLALTTRDGPLNPEASWFYDPKMSGGVVVDQYIHDLDYLNWIFGHPTHISSHGSKSTTDCWDQVSSVVTYTKGTASAESSWWWRPSDLPFSSRLSLLCERGGVEIDVREVAWGSRGFPFKERVWVHRKGKHLMYPKLPRKDGYATEIEYFLNCVRNDKDPVLCGPSDARLALQSVLAARRSMDTESAVEIPS